MLFMRFLAYIIHLVTLTNYTLPGYVCDTKFGCFDRLELSDGDGFHLTHKLLHGNLGYECRECTLEDFLSLRLEMLEELPVGDWSKGPVQLVLPGGQLEPLRIEGVQSSYTFEEISGKNYTLIVRRLGMQVIELSPFQIVTEVEVQRNTTLIFANQTLLHKIRSPEGGTFALIAHEVDLSDIKTSERYRKSPLDHIEQYLPSGWTYEFEHLQADFILRSYGNTTVVAFRSLLPCPFVPFRTYETTWERVDGPGEGHASSFVPNACCLALTASCLACKEGVMKEEYCKLHPKMPGCPKTCCKALTASCLACTEGVTEQEHCKNHPETEGCFDMSICSVIRCAAPPFEPGSTCDKCYGDMSFCSNYVAGSSCVDEQAAEACKDVEASGCKNITVLESCPVQFECAMKLLE